ncbi:hypothetical protein KC345_g103 [Hortaea werneckii]|nr:hypothetical protein KC345_g103 [Hortaea werneckii]
MPEPERSSLSPSPASSSTTASITTGSRSRSYESSSEPREENAENATFEFMDLPPELRNCVYRELLSWSEKPRMYECFPQILQASKQIRAEAESILYGDQPYDIHLRFSSRLNLSPGRQPSIDLTIEQGKSKFTYNEKHFSRCLKTRPWREEVLRMHHVKILLHFVDPTAHAVGDPSLATKLMKTQHTAANHVLYSFAALLSTNGTNIKTFQLQINAQHQEDVAAAASEIIGPLRKLGPAIADIASFSGISDDTGRDLLEKMRAYDVAQDNTVKFADCEKLLSTWRNLREGMEQCKEDMLLPGSRNLDDMVAKAWNLQQLLECHDYMDNAWDQNLTRTATALGEAIERIRGFVRAGLEQKAAKMQRLAASLS